MYRCIEFQLATPCSSRMGAEKADIIDALMFSRGFSYSLRGVRGQRNHRFFDVICISYCSAIVFARNRRGQRFKSFGQTF